MALAADEGKAGASSLTWNRKTSRLSLRNSDQLKSRLVGSGCSMSAVTPIADKRGYGLNVR
jgi:hypothetical protein